MKAHLLLALFGLALAGSAPVLSQEVYGMTAITITATETDTYHDTELDYAAAFYYDAARTDGFLYQSGALMVSYGLVDSPIADFYLYTAATPGLVYEGITNHYVRCYYYEEVESTVIYEDPFGFSFLGSGDYGGNNGFVPPDEFATVTVQDYYLGSTYVSETAPLAQQPASLTLTRGSLLNFTASGSPGGGIYSPTVTPMGEHSDTVVRIANHSGDPNTIQLQNPAILTVVPLATAV